MLHRTNRERYERIKKLDRNQKELYKWFKDIFYQKKCNGDKVEKNVQNKIKELIFSTNDLLECRLISENKHKISFNLPYEDEGEKQNEVFIKLLDIINEKNIGLENVHFFDEPSIFTVLRNIENISNNLDKVDKDKIFSILKSRNNEENYKYKVKVTLKFLINFSSIKDKEIIENSIFILLGENYNKIKVLETLIDEYEANTINIDMIKMFQNSISNESNNINVNTINKIINKICTYNHEEMDFLYENLHLVKNLIQKLKSYYNNPNIDIITDLIDNKFIRINKEIQYSIIDNTAKMNFSGEEHIKLYKKIVNNILKDSENYNVVNYYLTKITEVESLKSLEMLLDLYPFMSKYTKNSHNHIFNQLSDLNNLENIDYDDKTKRKKLIIPLNID